VKKTFVDTGVLIAAVRGQEPIATTAREILDDPDREFIASIFLKLEVLPKTIYNKNLLEAELYEAFFDTVAYWADSFDEITENAYQEACSSGLAAMDALHVAAALSAGATELVTIEGPTKSIHRTKSIKIMSIIPTEAH